MSQTISPCDGCTNDCPERGCLAWRTWWVGRWNKNVHRKIQPNHETREVFRYEHPDREREMEANHAE